MFRNILLTFAFVLFASNSAWANSHVAFWHHQYSNLSNAFPEYVLLKNYEVINPNQFDVEKIVYSDNLIQNLRSSLQPVSMKYYNWYNHQFNYKNDKTYMTGDAIIYYRNNFDNWYNRMGNNITVFYNKYSQLSRLECANKKLFIKYKINIPYSVHFWRSLTNDNKINVNNFAKIDTRNSYAEFYVPNISSKCMNYYNMDSIKNTIAKHIDNKLINNRVQNIITSMANKQRYGIKYL